MTLDRDKAREVLQRFGLMGSDQILDALAGCVTDDPQIIDRDALEDAIDDAAQAAHEGSWSATARREHADAILALLRPDPRIAQMDHLVTVTSAARDRAEAKLAQIEELCTSLETPGESFGAAKRLRAILRGDS